MVAGAGGGPRIITAVWQTISNVIDFKMRADAADAAPRIHHQHPSGTTAIFSQGTWSPIIGAPEDVLGVHGALGKISAAHLELDRSTIHLSPDFRLPNRYLPAHHVGAQLAFHDPTNPL